MRNLAIHRLVLGSAICCLHATVAAQDFLGFSYNTAVGAASRGTLGAGAGELMTRIDGTDCAGWGTDTPGFRTVRSIACLVQDHDAATPETFGIKLYPEDPARPGFPDLTAGISFVAGMPGPNGIGGVAELRVATPSVPVAVPIQGGGDVFVAFVLPAATAGDGLAIQVVLGFNPGAGFTTYDTPSAVQGGTPVPAGNPATSRFLSRTDSSIVYNARRQCWLDVAHSGAGGTALAITNQTSFPGSNNPPPDGFGPAPGTGDLLSGSAPDVGGSNAGRADDVAMRFFKTGLASGQLVAFLIDRDLSPVFGTEQPLAAFFPGATGSTCLGTPDVFGFRQSVGGEAWLVTTIPIAVRAQLLGLVAKQQAVAVDTDGNLHASPCEAMRF